MNLLPLEHLTRLTRRDGLVQHARGARPDLRYGYSIDDNARAIVALLGLAGVVPASSIKHLLKPYVKFLVRAQTPEGWFINFFDKHGKPLERQGSANAYGQAIWALSELARYRADLALAQRVRRILKRSLPRSGSIHDLRALAFLLLGACARKDRKEAKRLVTELLNRFRQNATKKWPWPEDTLTYANGLIPMALAQAGSTLTNRRALKLAEQSFQFLDTTCRIRRVPAPIGNKGWYRAGGRKARYDQQPIDAAYMVLAATALYRATGQERYLEQATDWWGWFFGNNTNAVVMIDERSGGIYDGLTPTGVNPNQGAENVVMYLLGHGAVTTLTPSRQSHPRPQSTLVGN